MCPMARVCLVAVSHIVSVLMSNRSSKHRQSARLCFSLTKMLVLVIALNEVPDCTLMVQCHRASCGFDANISFLTVTETEFDKTVRLSNDVVNSEVLRQFTHYCSPTDLI